MSVFIYKSSRLSYLSNINWSSLPNVSQPCSSRNLSLSICRTRNGARMVLRESPSLTVVRKMSISSRSETPVLLQCSPPPSRIGLPKRNDSRPNTDMFRMWNRSARCGLVMAVLRHRNQEHAWMLLLDLISNFKKQCPKIFDNNHPVEAIRASLRLPALQNVGRVSCVTKYVTKHDEDPCWSLLGSLFSTGLPNPVWIFS